MAITRPSLNLPSRARRLALGSLLALPGIVRAQFRVEVDGIGANKIAVAIAAFKGETALQRPITAVAMRDLERTGQFKGMPIAEGELDDTVRIDTSPWRTQGWDAVVCGSVTRLPDGTLRWGVRIWDTLGGKDLGGQSLTVHPADARLAAHRMADFVYTTLTGVRGIFSTRIAYVTKASGSYSIQVADADGAGRQTALSSTAPLISPTWSPDGKHIAYVSRIKGEFKLRVMDLASEASTTITDTVADESPCFAPNSQMILYATLIGGEEALMTSNVDGTIKTRFQNVVYASPTANLTRQVIAEMDQEAAQ